MLLSMGISIAFTIVDTCAVLGAYPLGFPTGIEPFWKVGPRLLRRPAGLVLIRLQLAFIFKCLSDTIILDDFKTILDRLGGRFFPDPLQSPALGSPLSVPYAPSPLPRVR
ncbi:hypothetical protein IFM51744_10453, partial [Aspergillus udagawae]